MRRTSSIAKISCRYENPMFPREESNRVKPGSLIKSRVDETKGREKIVPHFITFMETKHNHGQFQKTFNSNHHLTQPDDTIQMKSGCVEI